MIKILTKICSEILIERKFNNQIYLRRLAEMSSLQLPFVAHLILDSLPENLIDDTWGCIALSI